MATDVARLSFDAGRHYTGVLAQQGRVSLEAEENEAQRIDADERRAELTDIVGPAGTPDNGYAVSQGAGFDLTIGPGTMYVGGNRVTLDAPLDYSAQPDWLDYSDDPDWVPVPAAAPGHEDVVLVLIERDVTAVEDPVLREAALGGPDGAARLRLLQHVERLATDATTCAGALQTSQSHWSSEGLTFDPATMELTSLSKLQVTWAGAGQPTDPCEPSAAGGYLGAENQAIRVQVAAVNPDGTFDLLWGWDDASMLYPVTSDGAAQPTLTFARSPVDDYHQPQSGQPVQVLRDAGQLTSTDGTVEGWIASLSGQDFVLSASYQPDTKTLQLPSAITGDAASPAATPQLYLRAWQRLLPSQSLDSAIMLTGTGTNVTITTSGGAPPHLGDYWVIAMRPSTPQAVYPARLLREPQQPDGPRMWACPLAVISWPDDSMVIDEDCRYQFPPLVDLSDQGGGCCTVSVKAADGQGAALQRLVDQVTAARSTRDRSSRVTICLKPGRYLLDRPLLLGQAQSNLTIEGCSAGAIVAAANPADSAFAQGLIVLDRASNVTIAGLQLELPLVPVTQQRTGGQALSQLDASLQSFYGNRGVGVGIRVVQSAVFAVRDCLFRYPQGPATTPSQKSSPDKLVRFFPKPGHIFQVGVMGGAECWGMTLERNRFLREEPSAEFVKLTAGEVPNLVVGFLLAPSLLFPSSNPGALKEVPVGRAARRQQRKAAAAPAGGGAAGGGAAALGLAAPARGQGAAAQATSSTAGAFAKPPGGILARALLTDARFADNVFDGLTIAIVAFADLGRITIEDNTIRRCRSGILLYSMRAQAALDLVSAYLLSTGNEAAAAQVGSVVISSMLDPATLLASLLGRTFPLPADFVLGPRERAVGVQEAASLAHRTDPGAWTAAFLQYVLTQLAGTPAKAQQAAAEAAPEPGAPRRRRLPAAPQPAAPAPAAPRRQPRRTRHKLRLT